jgi:hypothetical protein
MYPGEMSSYFHQKAGTKIFMTPLFEKKSENSINFHEY